MYVAIQQVNGAQPTNFMKLARPMTAEEIHACIGQRLPLDPDWMERNGYRNINGWSTSPIMEVRAGEKRMILLLKTANSTYQAIPDFKD